MKWIEEEPSLLDLPQKKIDIIFFKTLGPVLEPNENLRFLPQAVSLEAKRKEREFSRLSPLLPSLL